MLFFDVISVAHGTKNEVSGDPQVNEPEPDLAEDMLLATQVPKASPQIIPPSLMILLPSMISLNTSLCKWHPSI